MITRSTASSASPPATPAPSANQPPLLSAALAGADGVAFGTPRSRSTSSYTGFGASAGTSSVSAFNGRTMPYPVWSSFPGAPASFAVANNRVTICRAGISGNLARNNATAPDTNAAELLVPSPDPAFPRLSSATMSTPGAATST